MDELEQYIREKYRQDGRELDELRQLAADALPTVADQWNPKEKAWPYIFGGPLERFSFSTNAMILFMLSVVLERTQTSGLLPTLPQNSGIASMLFSRLKREFGKDYQEKVGNRFSEGLSNFIFKVRELEQHGTGSGTIITKPLTQSKTYGDNDVLTLTWLTELLRVAQITDPAQYTELRTALGKVVDELKTTTVEKSPTSQRPRLRCLFYREQIYKEELRSNPIEHPFPLVRLVQLLEAYHRLKIEAGCRATGRLKETDLGGRTLREFFENGLHEHIAFYSIPDSRFDPAYLVFCLEGALRFPTSTVSIEAIERALTVLEDCQEKMPYWQSLTPILANPQGSVLFPVSVEVANSLLRITDILDRRHQEPRYFLRCRPLLQRYVRWLIAQRVDKSDEKPYYGWHSENVADPDPVHLWFTSELVVFLLTYQIRFQEGIAHIMLKASGLQVDRTTTRDRAPGMRPSEHWEHGTEIGKRDGWLQKEPLLGHRIPSSRYVIYNTIMAKYLKRREQGTKDREPAYSILLYGPPGTAKTTVCREIAKALSWQFITVTPSDFLAGGSAEVEARAKAMFTALQEQRDKVILLDEIDHFLLDRESLRYARQTGIFQFMTPGMLTKINDLRAAKSVIFILATNYEERIDPAIKRPGRIDDKLLLLPPNLTQRNRILRDDLCAKKTTLKDPLVELARETPLFTYTELKALIDEIDQKDFATDAALREALSKARQSIKPAITLRGYARRFYDTSDGSRSAKRPDKVPSVEYLILLYLWLEAFFGPGEGIPLANLGRHPSNEDVTQALKVLDPNLTPTSSQDRITVILKRHVDDDDIVRCLAEWIPKLDRSP
jgi:ATPase family associated with various cellular activities (AAA)